MQSTQQNQVLSSYSNSSAPAKVAEMQARRGIDRSFIIACCLGSVTVVFGLAALVYQFAPEFNRLKNSISEVPQISNLRV